MNAKATTLLWFGGMLSMMAFAVGLASARHSLAVVPFGAGFIWVLFLFPIAMEAAAEEDSHRER